MLDELLDYIAPFSCVRCGSEGKLVCTKCSSKIIVTKHSTCPICNKLTDDFKLCKSCRVKNNLIGVKVASHYEGEIKTLIRMLKYERAKAAAHYLANILVPIIAPGEFDVITWVPTSSRRFRQRGYNQSELIASQVAQLLGLAYSDTLGRFGHSRQVGTPRKLRLSQTKGRFYPVKAHNFIGKRVLIIDDVITTGATLSECARMLKNAGAKSVWGATVAKH